MVVMVPFCLSSYLFHPCLFTHSSALNAETLLFEWGWGMWHLFVGPHPKHLK
jgi:hypothetical protein